MSHGASSGTAQNNFRKHAPPSLDTALQFLSRSKFLDDVYKSGLATKELEEKLEPFLEELTTDDSSSPFALERAFVITRAIFGVTEDDNGNLRIPFAVEEMYSRFISKISPPISESDGFTPQPSDLNGGSQVNAVPDPAPSRSTPPISAIYKFKNHLNSNAETFIEILCHKAAERFKGLSVSVVPDEEKFSVKVESNDEVLRTAVLDKLRDFDRQLRNNDLRLSANRASLDKTANGFLKHIQNRYDERLNDIRIQRDIERVEMDQTLEGRKILIKGGSSITAKNKEQAQFMRSMQGFQPHLDSANSIVFGLGPAGTGKTFLACAHALAGLKSGKFDRIILTKPAVEAGEELGFLPGDLHQKMMPHLMPLYDSMASLLGNGDIKKGEAELRNLMERGVIEILPLAFARGRSLKDAVMLVDEAQNCSYSQLKMMLTRLGDGSQIILTGDPRQSDLPLQESKSLQLMEKRNGILKIKHDTQFRVSADPNSVPKEFIAIEMEFLEHQISELNDHIQDAIVYDQKFKGTTALQAVVHDLQRASASNDNTLREGFNNADKARPIFSVVRLTHIVRSKGARFAAHALGG
jgi:phosphate starvation-inducible protein PhoH